MSPLRRSTLTLGRKFGLTFGVLVLILATVCAVVLHHVGRMRADAETLVEETEESAQGNRLKTEIIELQLILSQTHRRPGPEQAALLAQAAAVLERASRLLDELVAAQSGHVHQMAEHQALEGRLFQGIRAGLEHVRKDLAPGVDGVLLASPEALDEARRLAAVLETENRNETARAHADVERRAMTALWIMLFTVLFSVLAVCGSLWFVFSAVVRPVLRVRDGAERFGRGELRHRIHSRRRDELGDLARSFDQMADRIAATHEILEERIKVRTRELVRAARLADLGTLAAGVAHEINNPLASIASSAEGLERRLRRREVPMAEQLEQLQTIARESYRAHEITTRLLAFARQDPGPVGAVDVGPVVNDLALLLRHQLEQQGVRLQVTLARELPRVRANGNELKQALLNLLANARDASPRGGVIELRAGRRGEEVDLEVHDQGPGVPDEILDRIFDPFFTTKPAGKGTGLGLAVACAIVEGFGGRLHAENLPTGGACFRITLPLAEESEA